MVAKIIIRSKKKKAKAKAKPSSKKITSSKKKPNNPKEVRFPKDWDPSKPLPKEEWESFVEAIFNQGSRMNITEAYMHSYPKATKDSAYSAGPRLFGNVRIVQRLQWLQTQAANDNISTAEERMEQLTKIHRADLGQFLESLPDIGEVISFGKDHPQRAALKKLRQSTRYEGDNNEVTIHEKDIELHDPVACIKEMNKMQGSYPIAAKMANAITDILANGVKFITNIEKKEEV